ncbi:MAG: RHS repeat-associated core domain-containing protein [Verrucomicrobiota bacterium]
MKLAKIAKIKATPITANSSEVTYDYDASGNLTRIKPKLEPETVHIWSQQNPHELLSVGRGDGTEAPAQGMTYVEGLVTSVSQNASGTAEPMIFSGAKATARERFQTGPSTVTVARGTSPVASINVDNRGRPTEFANRPYEVDDQDRPVHVAVPFSDARLHYDDLNPIYRFRGNLIATEQAPTGANGKFISGSSYDGSAWNRVSTMTNADGLATSFDYALAGDFSAAGEVRQTRGPITIRNLHNEFGQPQSEITSDTAVGATPPFHRDFNYGTGSLSADGGLRTGESAPGLNGSSQQRDSFGRINNFSESGAGYLTTYFPGGQAQTLIDATGTRPNVGYSYDGGRIKTETITAGEKFIANTYTYDNVLSSHIHQLVREETGLPASTTVYGYNGQAQLTGYSVDNEAVGFANSGLFSDSMSGSGVTRSLIYGGPPGSPTSVTEQGVTATIAYDAAAREEIIIQQGLATKLIYDDNGGVLRHRAKRKEYRDLNGILLAADDLTFDGAGRVRTTTSKTGRVRTYEYFADGDVRLMDINGTTLLSLTRNAAGLLTQSRLNEFQFDYSTFDADYGLPQNEKLTLQPSFRTITRQKTYDRMGHLKTVTLPQPGGIYTFSNDGFGHPTSRIDPDGVTVFENYSPSGLLLSTTFGDGRNATYIYTPQRRIDFVSGGPGLMDYEYDNGGLVKQITYPDGTTAEFKNRNLFMEADVVKHGSLVQNHTWADGRLMSIDVPSTGDSLNYTFDSFGRTASVSLNGVEVGYRFNEDGEMSGQTNTIDNVSRVWGVNFNPLNHALSEIYPSGLTLAFAPNTFGQPASLSAAGISTVEWVGGGLIERVVYAGGLHMTRHYDGALRVDQIVYHTGNQPGQGDVAGFTYDLTAGGRILSEHRIHEGRRDVFIRSLPTLAMRIRDFYFSATNSSGAGAVASVTGLGFSAFGEIQSPTARSGLDPRSIQADITEINGRMTAVEGQPVGYNDQGAITNVPVWVYLPGQSALTRVQAVLEYDGLGMVRAVHRADGVEVAYTRDGLGNVVRKIVTGPGARVRAGTNDYFWAGGRLLEDRERKGGVSKFRRYVYLGRYVSLVQLGNSESGPLQDFVPLLALNGSIGGYATPTGALTETILYGAYGTPVFNGGDGGPGSSIASTLLFHGAFYDDATGLYQLGQRNLHPQVGRFLQRDNALFADSLAMFTAFNGDPAGRVDPAGTESDSETLDPMKLYEDARKEADSFGKSADGFLKALNDSRMDRDREHSGLGLATFDLAQSALKLSGSFGDDDFKSTVKQTLGQLDNVKIGFDIAKTLSDWSNDRDMLAAIKSVAWSRPVPGFSTLRQTLQEGGKWSTASVGELERRFGSDDNFKRAKFYDINKEGRSGIVSDATKDYINKREGHLLAIGKGVQSLGDAYLQYALKDDKSHAATVARQLSKSSGALLSFAEKLREVSASADIAAMRKISSNIGLLEELQAPGAIAALQVSYTAGFEVGKLAIIALNDPDVAQAYEEQVQKFSDNGGWLTVAGGILSTVGADDTALIVQGIADAEANYTQALGIAYDRFIQAREKNVERTEYYLRSIKAP